MFIRRTLIAFAFVLVGAVGMVNASPAFAESALTPGASPAIIEGTQSTAQKMVFGAGTTTVKCTTSTESGTTSGTTVNHLTVALNFGGCTLGGLSATITVNNCRVTWTVSVTALIFNFHFTTCPVTAALTIRVPSSNCHITISNQGPIIKLTLANVAGTPTTVNETLAATGIAYTGNSSCPANVIGSHTDGEWTGGYALKAYKDESGVKGAQVNLAAD